MKPTEGILNGLHVQSRIHAGAPYRPPTKAEDCANACYFQRNMRSLWCALRSWPDWDTDCTKNGELLTTCLSNCK